MKTPARKWRNGIVSALGAGDWGFKSLFSDLYKIKVNFTHFSNRKVATFKSVKKTQNPLNKICLFLDLTFNFLLNNYLPPQQYIVIYKNNQTTSTKCQYQAAASKPKWC